ncbi:hypothetical protein U8527_02660 [Kordia algicida OT-1]|uniref:Uncharacterized protein n=1 Tax=Kordia algicida OT-1 TaxID=391587 RepID=A9DNK4_9FLAO|nr:hypothetical protein [Kordia algicida]EDP97213.1 hypothetical protein KAOT1_18662 [Kordia algicida OT-1]
MKKQNIKNLSLRKREISNLNFTFVQGGKGEASVDNPCATQTEFPTCNAVSIKFPCATQTEFPTCNSK